MEATASGGVERTTATRRTRLLGTRAATTGIGAVALLAACTTVPNPDPTVAPTMSPTDSPTSSPTTSPTGGTGEAVAIYYTLDTRAGIKIAREYRDLTGDNRLVAAVEAMLDEPEDPDYSTSWNPDTDVLGVGEENGTIEVNLSEEARTANVGSEAAAQLVQQLVYTVTDAADDEDAGVQLLIEGEPAGEMWGTFEWNDPVTRADPLDVRLLVQIDEPREGATPASPVKVSGEAAAFEATVPWRVLDEEGEEVDSGFTMTTEGQTFAPFEFEVQLDPGEYTIEISEDDPSGGEAGTPMTDTKTVNVR
jgi:spore germination protein GerM